MKEKLIVNLRDIDQIKTFYGKTTEDLLTILHNEDNELCGCIQLYELKEFFKEYYGY